MAEATTLQEMDELDNMLRVSKSLTMREMGYWVPMPGPQQLASVIVKSPGAIDTLARASESASERSVGCAVLNSIRTLPSLTASNSWSSTVSLAHFPI